MMWNAVSGRKGRREGGGGGGGGGGREKEGERSKKGRMERRGNEIARGYCNDLLFPASVLKVYVYKKYMYNMNIRRDQKGIYMYTCL